MLDADRSECTHAFCFSLNWREHQQVKREVQKRAHGFHLIVVLSLVLLLASTAAVLPMLANAYLWRLEWLFRVVS
jgi:hypothetical protein